MVDQRTRVVAAVLNGLKLPPRFRLKLVKDDPIRLELSITPAYGKDPILVGIVESQDLVARRDREEGRRSSWRPTGGLAWRPGGCARARSQRTACRRGRT